MTISESVMPRSAALAGDEASASAEARGGDDGQDAGHCHCLLRKSGLRFAWRTHTDQ
jgi:hypothetical protein